MLVYENQNEASPEAEDRLIHPGPPLVSVIIAVYNGEELIVGAVMSVLRQAHEALEVLVVDDGSTDRTLDRLGAVADRRLRVLSQPNGGTASARNRALREARGTYIAFLDADDRWLPEKVSADIAVLRKQQGPAIAYGWYYAVDEKGSLLHLSPKHRLSGLVFDQLLREDNFLIPSLTMYDRRVLDAVGPFRENLLHEDHEMVLRAAKAFPIVPTLRRLVAYRQSVHGKARGVLRDYDAAYRAEMDIGDTMRDLLTNEQAATFREYKQHSLLRRFLMYGFPKSARRLASSSGLSIHVRDIRSGLVALSMATGVNVVRTARIMRQKLQRLAPCPERPALRALYDAGVNTERGPSPHRQFDASASPASSKASPPVVLIAIPSFRRPVPLQRLLESLARQTLAASAAEVSIVVIDNDPFCSAQAITLGMAARCPYDLHYVSEPRRGLSVVRNCALSYAQMQHVDYLLMVDDDEVARGDWLAEMLSVRNDMSADAVVGAVPQILPVGAPQWLSEGGFFDLPIFADRSLLNDGYTGNCLLDMQVITRLGLSFDLDCNLAGGEDQLFFRQLAAAGGRIAYAAHAFTPELVPAERLTTKYLLKRAARRGNSLWMCDAKMYRSFTRRVIRLFKGILRIGVGAVLMLPRSFVAGRAGFTGSLCDVAKGIGTLQGACGVIIQEYADVNSASGEPRS